MSLPQDKPGYLSLSCMDRVSSMRNCGNELLLHIRSVSEQTVQASLYKIMAHPRRNVLAPRHQASLKANENPEQQSFKTAPWPRLVASACRWPALHLGHATPSRSQKTHHHGRLLTCNKSMQRAAGMSIRRLWDRGRQQC